MNTNGNHRGSDLHGKLHELHFASQSLDNFIKQLTILSADIVDGDTSAGVTVVREGQPTTVAASDERTIHFYELQYGNGDGSCLAAARSGDLVTVHDTGSDDRWPDYHAHAYKAGLRSSLSVPLELGGDGAGALNLYVFELREFDEAERAVIGQFCDEVSRAVSLAIRHDQVSRQNSHLHAAMATRRVIDQAIGLIMGRTGADRTRPSPSCGGHPRNGM